jgi:hypothetical protein
MRILVFFLALQFVGAGAAYGAPLTLKCTTSEGTPSVDLVVDVENNTLMWGLSRYRIHSVDERYISAYLDSNDRVGGETWVLNRVTGEYLRADVSITWPTPAAVKSEPGKLTADTYSGRCTRPLL